MNTDDVNVSANLDDNASGPLKKLLDLLNDYVKKVGEAQNAEHGSENSTKNVGNAFTQLLGPLSGVVGSLGGLAAGLFSAKAALDGFWSAVTEADKLDDLSDKTGILASDLAALSYAAKIGGSSLEGLLAAYQKLGRSAVASEEDMKRQAQAFKDLGINVTDSNGDIKSSSDLFLEIADKFKDLKDGPEKSAVAFRLFGASAKDLIPLLNRGAEGIKALREEQEKLAHIDPTTFNEFAKASGDLNDNIDKTKTVFSGFFEEIGAAVVPVMNVLIEEFIDSTKEGGLLRDVLNGVVAVFKNAVIPIVGMASQIFDAFTSTVKIAGKGIGAFVAIVAALATGGGISAVKQIISDYGDDVAKVANEHVEFVDKLKNAAKGVKEVGDNASDSGKKTLNLGTAAKAVKSELQAMVDQLVIANKSFGMDESAKQSLEAQLKYAKDIKAGLGKNVADALLAQANAQIKRNQSLREAKDLQEAYEKAETSIEDYRQQTELLAYEATLVGKNADERKQLIDRFKEEQQLRNTINGLSEQDAKNVAEETRAMWAARDAALAAVKSTAITNDILSQSHEAITDDVRTRLLAAKQLLDDGKITLNDYVTYQNEQMDRLKDKTKTTLDETQEFYKAAAQGIQGDLSTFIFDFAQGKLGSLTTAVKATLDKIVAQILAAKLATALFGSDFAKGTVGGFVGEAGSFLSSLFGGFRANGGPVQAGVPYIVGERQAEVFVPTTSGTILPNTHGLGSQNIMQLTITALDSKSVIQQLDNVSRKASSLFNRTTQYYNLKG